MNQWQPDYTNIVMAAKNMEAPRLPLYEHIICNEIMEQVLNKKFSNLYGGNAADKLEYFKNYCEFFKQMGYDTVSFECCIGGAMPGSGALGSHIDPVIKTRADFEAYPWDEIPDLYFKNFSDYFVALAGAMPQGMKAIGGVGNGVFECAQDLTGFTNLCYISYDDPDLYRELFLAIGKVMLTIWQRFLVEHGDLYCVCRFGDDLGYKSNTMLPADDIKTLIIPQYQKVIAEIHKAGKPFLLHSCGCIQGVMEELITVAKIDAKHSNEDQIAPFPEWVKLYGDRIGNFGGIDTDAVCRLNKQEMREYIHNVIKQSEHHGGFAFSSGNSIPRYVPLTGYLNMVEIVREYRNDFKG